MLETDGPYEGATCGVTNASGFKHAANSQIQQARACQKFYAQLKKDYNTYLTGAKTRRLCDAIILK
jgi:hypothetical protein